MNHKNTYVAIMAGGVGSRFWPSSRESLPKQFLDILGIGKSLIQLTAERFSSIVPPENILVLTNKAYVGLVQEHLPNIPAGNIIAEPSRNNTAPCNALLALKIIEKDPDATLVVVPSDHVILKEQVFLDNITKAVAYAAETGSLVTLSINPTRPDTGYGYIEVGDENDINGIKKVKQFKEKPNAETAQKYLDAGNFYWNAGIFIWKASVIVDSFNKNAKGIIDVLSEDLSKLNTSEEQDYIDRVYPNTESISIDYAILEKADKLYTISCDIGWSDLGTWNSLHAYLNKDDDSNVVIASSSKLENVKDVFVKTYQDKLVVIKDLEDYIIIDEKDALLIYPKSKEQEIKAVRLSIEEDRFL